MGAQFVDEVITGVMQKLDRRDMYAGRAVPVAAPTPAAPPPDKLSKHPKKMESRDEADTDDASSVPGGSKRGGAKSKKK